MEVGLQCKVKSPVLTGWGGAGDSRGARGLAGRKHIGSKVFYQAGPKGGVGAGREPWGKPPPQFGVRVCLSRGWWDGKGGRGSPPAFKESALGGVTKQTQKVTGP